jgi:hypothetical protein
LVHRDRGGLAISALPHHSADYAGRGAATEVKPSEPKKLFGRAMLSARLFASRQGTCGLPAVCAVRSRADARRRSSTNRALPRFHCFQTMARNRRLSRASTPANVAGSGPAWVRIVSSAERNWLGRPRARKPEIWRVPKVPISGIPTIHLITWPA